MSKKSIGEEAAIKLAGSKWWEGLGPREIAEFQLNTAELCMPFDLFHKAVEEAIGRPVYTHEFGVNYDGLVAEFYGDQPAPTFDQILAMIPVDKRVLVVRT